MTKDIPDIVNKGNCVTARADGIIKMNEDIPDIVNEGNCRGMGYIKVTEDITDIINVNKGNCWGMGLLRWLRILQILLMLTKVTAI